LFYSHCLIIHHCSQWAKADRVDEMDKAAKQAMDLHGPDAKMNVELSRCK
tara:strand:- start:429 stop:578 length:150 start_codon:yes stop_codon:yes gene_type:complete